MNININIIVSSILSQGIQTFLFEPSDQPSSLRVKRIWEFCHHSRQHHHIIICLTGNTNLPVWAIRPTFKFVSQENLRISAIFVVNIIVLSFVSQGLQTFLFEPSDQPSTWSSSSSLYVKRFWEFSNDCRQHHLIINCLTGNTNLHSYVKRILLWTILS